jgi:hypothetical protein
MNSEERLQMEEQFAKIAETRRPNSLEWLNGHRTRMERMRLEPEFMAWAVELNRAKLEDLSMTMHALIARLNPNGQRGFGHVGPPPQPKAQGKS